MSNEGKRIPILRIYNRAIVDELVRKGLKTAFKLNDDIEVEWAGHPNWYFRMSKFSLPYLRHECVPKTFVSGSSWTAYPPTWKIMFVKPLFSFAGPGRDHRCHPADLAAIPKEKPFAIHPARAHAIRARGGNALSGPTKWKCGLCTSGWTIYIR